LREGGRECSVWWRMISDIRSGVRVGADNWFEEGVRRIVGGGSSTYFWLDNWVEGHLYVCNSHTFLIWPKTKR